MPKIIRQCFAFIYNLIDYGKISFIVLIPERRSALTTQGSRNESSTPPTVNLTNPCLMDVEPGPCFGKFLKFYFNHEDKECKAFYFGGCYGNANQFQTVEECKFTCIENKWPPYPIEGPPGENGTESEEVSLIK